jgi:glycosyltransferase involved in cell wall biosynthesis
VHVVVPVHDEEETLDDCLASVLLAAEQVPVPVHVTVVLDACSDRSAQVAAAHPVHIHVVHARCVGAARAAGVGAATALTPHRPPGRTWIASTDADTRVPPSWLAGHLAAARAGHDLLLGPVVPDPAGLPPGVLREWHRRHRRGAGHVHGANLGVRHSAYVAAGGFAPVGAHEDLLLTRAVRRLGGSVAVGDIPVVTSARLAGRAPEGFAHFLTRLVDETERTLDGRGPDVAAEARG